MLEVEHEAAAKRERLQAVLHKHAADKQANHQRLAQQSKSPLSVSCPLSLVATKVVGEEAAASQGSPAESSSSPSHAQWTRDGCRGPVPPLPSPRRAHPRRSGQNSAAGRRREHLPDQLLYMKWMAPASCVEFDRNPHAPISTRPCTPALVPHDVPAAVHAALRSDAFVSRPPQLAGCTADVVIRWLLARVHCVNAIAVKAGAPSARVRVVWSKTLLQLGQLPRWPQDAAHILDLERLLELWLERADASATVHAQLLLFFFSHTWDRAHLCKWCATGRCRESANAHPDDLEHSKARALGTYGQLDGKQQAYYWIDFAGIDQEDAYSKGVGVMLLPLYVACMGGVILFEGQGRRYEPRAWTRVERMLGYAFAVDPGFIRLAHPLAPTLEQLCQESEAYTHRDGKFYLCITDPSAGVLTNDFEKEFMTLLSELAQQAVPMEIYEGIKSPLRLGVSTVEVIDATDISHSVESINRRFSIGSDHEVGDSVDLERTSGCGLEGLSLTAEPPVVHRAHSNVDTSGTVTQYAVARRAHSMPAQTLNRTYSQFYVEPGGPVGLRRTLSGPEDSSQLDNLLCEAEAAVEPQLVLQRGKSDLSLLIEEAEDVMHSHTPPPTAGRSFQFSNLDSITEIANPEPARPASRIIRRNAVSTPSQDSRKLVEAQPAIASNVCMIA